MKPSLRTKNDLSPVRIWVVVITLLALALGGSTQLSAQAVVATLMGATLLLAPPRNSLGAVPYLLFIAFFLISLAAFLPADWFPTPPWRQHLAVNLQLPLPAMRTPQPWLTLQSCALLFIGLAWAGYLLSRRWTRTQRLHAIGLLVFGVAILGAIAVAAYAFGFHVPGWTQEENRGWFPNRNQTADVLALTGILNYALIIDGLRKREYSGFIWLATLVPIGAALVVSYSRSGILLFFAGIVLWHLWPGSRRGSAKRNFLGLSFILILLALFFLFGGDTLERFQHRPDTAGTVPTGPTTSPNSLADKAGLRLAIHKDALRFSGQAPWLGIGLGNFNALFATARVDSIDQSRALHPESDWLWTACEMGWPAVLLILAGIGWWLRRCLPFDPGKRGESLRRAALVAVIMFLLHGLVDVSGHRIGSLCVALLLASLALPTVESTTDAEPFFMTARRPVSLFFSGSGLLILAVSAWWFSSLAPTTEVTLRNNLLPPTSADLDRIKARIISLAVDKQVDEVVQLADAGLQIAPLDWTLYFQRAWAELYQPGQLTQANTDFLTARALEPLWAKPCYDEGTLWLSVQQPDRCVNAWLEALRRDPASGQDLFAYMIGTSLDSDLVQKGLGEFAATNPDYLITFLDHAEPKDAEHVINHFLVSDPELKTLNTDQRTSFFTDWWQKGDQDGLVALLLNHPAWQKEGWPWLAQAYADQKNFQQAWQIVIAHAVPPALPTDSSDTTPADLEHDFYANPDNTTEGLMLLQAEIKAGNIDDALNAARAVEKNSDHPISVYYYEAQLWADKQQWELAWNAWTRYDNR